MFDTIQKKEINTVFVQVRSHGDSYYPSSVYPWSQYVTGVVGKECGFDPLQIMVEEAHKRKLSIHAWINPYRLMKDSQMEQVDDSFAIKKWYQNPAYMTKKDNYWYLNPGNTEVQNLIFSGVKELMENYEIDGVQIDDYFYVAPPTAFGQTEQDAKQNTTTLVKGLYDTVKSVNPKALFGVSPAGNYMDAPRSDSTQYTNLNLWCTEKGYLDYVAPQIYWDFNDPVAPFEQVLSKWESLCEPSQTKLYVGLAGYKFSKTDILSKQVERCLNSKNAGGYIFFRYDDIA